MPSGSQISAHAKGPSRNDDGLKRRIRTRQACESCRQRRRKCDGNNPCAQCVRFEYDCEYLETSPPAAKTNNVPTTDLSEDEQLPNPSSKRTSMAASNGVLQRELRKRSRPNGTAGSPDHRFPWNTSRPMIDHIKGRYSNPHSSILFPRRVGQNVNLDTELKFHSYGWNLSMRLEPTTAISPIVCNHFSIQEMSHYSSIFFRVVDPVYHFVDKPRYFNRCHLYWSSQSTNLIDFEALVCGIIALGSFFSENPSPFENHLADHARSVLEVATASAPARLSLDHVAGWICRTLYLRLTTRPLLAWYASCASMHVAEAMGLHVNIQEVDVAATNTSRITTELIAARQNLLYCATFLNALISVEYGRSRVCLQADTSSDMTPASPLAELIPILVRLEEFLEPCDRLDILSQIKHLPDHPPLFVLLKTDVAIHLYRRHVSLESENLSSEEAKVMIHLIQKALKESKCLLQLRQPWWNVLFTPFQSLLTLIAMDSDESIALIEDTMAVLSAVNKYVLSPLTTEALDTAMMLVQGLENQKSKQTSMLNRVTAWKSSQDLESIRSDSITGQFQFLGPNDMDFTDYTSRPNDWLQFLLGGSYEDKANPDALNFP